MVISIIDPWYSMSGRQSNLSEAKERTRGKRVKEAHPNSPQKSKTSFRHVSEQYLSLFE